MKNHPIPDAHFTGDLHIVPAHKLVAIRVFKRALDDICKLPYPPISSRDVAQVERYLADWRDSQSARNAARRALMAQLQAAEYELWAGIRRLLQELRQRPAQKQMLLFEREEKEFERRQVEALLYRRLHWFCVERDARVPLVPALRWFEWALDEVEFYLKLGNLRAAPVYEEVALRLDLAEYTSERIEEIRQWLKEGKPLLRRAASNASGALNSSQLNRGSSEVDGQGDKDAALFERLLVNRT